MKKSGYQSEDLDCYLDKINGRSAREIKVYAKGLFKKVKTMTGMSKENYIKFIHKESKPPIHSQVQLFGEVGQDFQPTHQKKPYN